MPWGFDRKAIFLMAALITRGELLTYCPSLSATANATLDAYIEAASDSIEKYCNRSFAIANVTERHPYRFTSRIYLRRTPVTSVSNVTLFYRSTVSADVGGMTDLVESNLTETASGNPVQYGVDPNNGIVTVDPFEYRVSSEQAQLRWFYEVNYRGGFANIPTPVKAATARYVESMVTQWGPNSNIQSERVGDYAYSKFQTAPLISHVSETGLMLAPYVRMGANGI